MAVNYNILRPEGPTNLYEGFAAGQQAAAQNALAQQKMAQERDLMSMRRQEFQANLESSQAERRRKAVAEKTAMFRDRVLRAPTPQAARELVRLQHSDPDLGPVIQQFGSLDQDLADIPDDPTGFENWRQREAMGAAEFIKSQASEQRFQALVARARGGQQGATVPSAAPAGQLVAAPMPSPTGTVRDVAPAAAPGAASRAVFNQDAIVGIDPEAQKSISLILDDAAQLRAKADEFRGSVRASGFLNQAEQLENQAASMLAVQKRRASEPRFDTGAPATAEQVNAARQALAVGQTPVTNTLAPAAAPVTNAMLAPAAQPAAAQPAAARPAGGGRTPDQIRGEIDTLSMSNDPRAARMVQTLQKEYAAALKNDPNRPLSLSDRFVPVGRLVFDRQTERFISPTQAQLTQSQERATTAAAPAARAPLGYRFTPTGDLEPIPGGPATRAAEGAGAAQLRPLTAAQEAARRDKLGKEFKSATAALQTTQDVLDSIAFVRAEPGLPRATGFTGTFLPSIPEGAAAAAETRLKNLEGKVTALGKAQAAATGAIGSIANQEWQILRDQIAAIDRTKGTGPLLKQLELVELQAQGAMARIQDAYQRQFGEDFERFPQFSTLPAPRSSFTPRAPATTSNLSPQEQTELDQLRQRFKGR